MNRRIYLSPPHLSGHEADLLMDALDSNWIAPLGPHVSGFERDMEAFLGGGHCVALSSGTAAVHLALLLSGVGAGDTVFCSTLTFVGSANPILYVGAHPFFLDCERLSWNLDPARLEEGVRMCRKLGLRPKAVVVTDVMGQCADFDRINEICERERIVVIEDAAEALGASHKGSPAGTLGQIGVFSFNGNKIITTSGGGMLVLKDPEQADRARFLATQARDPAPYYQHSEPGFNYRLSNLLAAVGRGQLKILQDRVRKRRANFDFYREALDDLPGLDFMPEASFGRCTRWLTCITIDPRTFGSSHEDVRLALEADNIEARPIWKPLHCQPLFESSLSAGGGVAEGLFNRGLCLPSGSDLSQYDLERITTIVRQTSRLHTDSGDL